MVNVDAFIQEVQLLTKEYRMREVLDVLEKGKRENADFPQFQVLCMYNIAGIYVEQAGDGEKARQVFFELLRFVDADKSMIYAVPSLQEVMEDMYVKACENISDLAVSYEEYEQYMAKITTVRQHTAFQQGQMELIANMKNEGQPWVANMLLLAVRYAGDDGAGNQGDRFGNACALYGLILKNRRMLRPQRSDMKIIANNYSACMFNLVQRALNYCHSTKTPCNPDNYIFILDHAISVLEESKRDVGDPEVTEKDIADLNRTKEKLMEIKRKAEQSGYKYSRPDTLGGGETQENPFDVFIRKSEQQQQPPYSEDPFQTSGPQEEAMVQSMEKGMRVGWLIIAIILSALAAFLWYKGLTVETGAWWRILLAVLCTFGAIGNYIFFGASAKGNKRR